MTDMHPIRRLALQYPQLCLPIMPKERETEEYRACVLMGEPVRRDPDFTFSEEDEFSFVSTPVGEVPVLVLADREDFSEEKLAEADVRERFSNNGEPEDCLDALKAYLRRTRGDAGPVEP